MKFQNLLSLFTLKLSKNTHFGIFKVKKFYFIKWHLNIYPRTALNTYFPTNIILIKVEDLYECVGVYFSNVHIIYNIIRVKLDAAVSRTYVSKNRKNHSLKNFCYLWWRNYLLILNFRSLNNFPKQQLRK